MKSKSPKSPKKTEFLIVGIGASAGGIQALKEFFQHTPPDTGIAFVVILHLSPDHDSKLAEVLQVSTEMPVTRATDKVIVEPDHVYVVPPNQHLLMQDGHIIVSPNTEVEDRRAPVDIFFRTLAESHGQNAVCVVLSGTGANGSMGLKRVKELGGAAFVQSPREAEYNEMPRNSITTELVDEILPVAEIPNAIISYRNRMHNVHIPVEVEKRPEDLQHALREIFTQLRIRTGHDFSNYKRPTLLRRIERRINIRNLPDLPAYTAFVSQHPEEINALLKDLLISVTNFFRDKKAFDVFSDEILPSLIKEKNSEEHLRIWVAGCATGEEAYSMAMLCAEQTMNVLDAPKVQIFATDIDEAAINAARDGYYTLNDAADVSPERLRRFFIREGEGFRIRREIREMILFANHNFIKDPPFSHLDIISCRNVLIYLNRTAQERVMETFHFALNSGGYLFLGTSESADGSSDLYSTYNREHHIFQSRKKLIRTFPVPESIPNLRLEAPRIITHTEKDPILFDRVTYGEMHQRLLEEYAPPSLVVNEEYDIVHLSEKVGRYLQMSGGEVSQNLLKLVRQELRLELRSALYQAVQRQTGVEARGLKVTIDDKPETVNIHVRPVIQGGEITRGFILVIFETNFDEKGDKEVLLSSDEPVARQLEAELANLKSRLRVSNEQHELHAEELKASNEELQAMNEELRSAAEELETSKEELQSINEELRTVNQELKVKIDETSLTSNNLQNLINSSSIGTIFLDRSLRIALFTPAICELFNLIPADHGRPLSDITHHLEYKLLLDDAEIVLERLNTIEKEVRTVEGKFYIMSILPYRTAEDHINGVVITFVDITKRKEAEMRLRSSEEMYRRLFESIDEGFKLCEIVRDHDGKPIDVKYVEVNPAYDKIFGTEGSTLSGKSMRQVPTVEERWIDRCVQVVESGKSTRFEDYSQQLDRWFDIYLFPQEHDTFGGIYTDTTNRKKAEQALHESRERLRITMESATDFAIITLDADGIIRGWNSGAQNIFGYNETEVLGQPGDIIFTDKDRLAGIPEMEMKQARNEGRAIDERWHQRKDGSKFFMSGVMAPIKNTVLTGYVKVARDVTDRKLLEEQKEEFIGIASHELKTPVTSIKAYVQMLQEVFRESGDTENSDFIGKLDAQVDRLTDLIRALLDTTKVSEGQLILNLKKFDLNQLISELVDELKHISKSHRLIMKLGRIPEITADRERIGQVITNFISNAIKYSPPETDIIVSTILENNEIKFSVKDKGIGIAEELQAKVFDRFFRVNNPQVYTYPGMGLGLYISSGVIQRHGGKIGVESKPGKGADFYFTLPLASEQEE